MKLSEIKEGQTVKVIGLGLWYRKERGVLLCDVGGMGWEPSASTLEDSEKMEVETIVEVMKATLNQPAEGPLQLAAILELTERAKKRNM